MAGTLFVGGMGLGSFDGEGGRVWNLAPMPMETRVFEGSVDKTIIEAQQFSDFLRLAQMTRAVRALQTYELGSDPPDLIVTPVGGVPIAVELTTLSVTDVSRQRLSEVRRLARDVTARIAAEPGNYANLVGRSASLAEHHSDEQRPPKRTRPQWDALVDAIAETLRSDFGVADEWPPEYNDGRPIPAEIARLGRQRIDEYEIAVHRGPDTGKPSAVTADIQLKIRASDLRERLASRIDAKDVPANQVLLITTGLIDSQGFVVVADRFIFNMLRTLVADGLNLEPEHLNQIIVHQWGSNDAMVIYQRHGAPVLVDTAPWGIGS